jgi:hypothetical protein
MDDSTNPAACKLRFRKLRIAWSVGWGVVAVLLCVLWVRSYWRVEYVRAGVPPACIEIKSADGNVHFYRFSGDGKAFLNLESLTYVEGNHAFASNSWDSYDSWYIVIPDWFATFVAAALVAAPWLSWKFSLRTLLISTTLVAVVLGLIVWLAHQ